MAFRSEGLIVVGRLGLPPFTADQHEVADINDQPGSLASDEHCVMAINSVGQKLRLARSLASHCTMKRAENSAWPAKPMLTHTHSLFIDLARLVRYQRASSVS